VLDLAVRREYIPENPARGVEIVLVDSIRLGNDVKTAGSSEPLPLSDLAFRVLRGWKEELGSTSPYIFPSPSKPGHPIRNVKTAWKATLRRAGVPHFPIYNLRHAFCTRLSWVAPDAVIQRAMRHTSPETKRQYQLGMVEQVREAMERANQRVYGDRVTMQDRKRRRGAKA